MSATKAREYADRADTKADLALGPAEGNAAVVLGLLAVAEALLSVARAIQQLPEDALDDER